MLDKKYKVLNNYFNKSEFNEEVLDITLRGISKIANTKIANRIKKEGLKKLHLYFNPDYLPFLTFFLKKNLDLCMKKQIYYVGSIDLNFKKFFIDQIKQFRIFYPFLYARKSSISRAQYMFINLNNFKNPEKEIKVSKMKWLKNLDKIENNYSYFRNLPISCYGHGPHRDTWFGHTFNATNLWFSITGVNKKNGLIIFPQVNNQDLKHHENPAYVKSNQYLGKPDVLSLNDRELLVFDPEILHATRINTSNETRIVYSGRLNKNKPLFYAGSKSIEYKYWNFSNDIKLGKYNKKNIFLRKDNLKKNNTKTLAKPKINFENILIDKKLIRGNKFKIIEKNKIKKNKLYQIKFINQELGMKIINSELKIFQAKCPHLNINLLDGYSINQNLICPGHGLEFNLLNGKSDCNKFKLKFYEILEDRNFIYLKF